MRARARQPHSPHRSSAQFWLRFHGFRTADLLLWVSGVIWFLEKQDDLLVCEIRRAQDDQTAFEFEIADSTGPTTLRFGSPKELITKYLDEQQRLFKDGWRPTSGDLAILE